MREGARAELHSTHYRLVQLDLTWDIEVFYMLFERCHTKNRKRSIKQHIKYFSFRSCVQLDHPIGFLRSFGTTYSRVIEDRVHRFGAPPTHEENGQ